MAIIKMGDSRAFDTIYYGPPEPGIDCGCTRKNHFVGQVQSFTDFNQSVAINSAGDLAVVGVPTDVGDPTSANPGRVDVYKYAAGTWSLVTSLDNSGDPATANLGWNVGLADDGTIVAQEYTGGRVHVFTQTSSTTWSHTLIRNSGSVNSQPAGCIARTTGDIIALVDSSGDTNFLIYKRITGTWGLQQTVSVSPDTIFDLAISADGDYIVTSGEDTAGPPKNTQLRVYTSAGVLSTWTLDSSYSPTTSNGNTRVYSKQAIAIAGDKSYIAVALPNDQDGSAVAGSVVLYKRTPSSPAYTQETFYRSASLGAGFYLGLGAVALADDGSRLVIGDPYQIFDGNEQGRVWTVDSPGGSLALHGSGPVYLLANYTRINNPYKGTTNKQRFGEAVAINGDGSQIVVASGDFTNAGKSTVDFFNCPVTTYLFRDTMGGTAGSFTGRSPDIGGAYTAENGSLADASVDGSGNCPSQPSGGSTCYAASDMTSAVGATRTLSIRFTVTLATTEYFSWDVATRQASGDKWANEVSLEFDPGGVWNLYVWTYNSSGTQVFNNSGSPANISAYITVGVESVITLTASPSGISVAVDGNVVVTDTYVTDVTPIDSVVFSNSIGFGGTGNININEISVTE